MAQSGKEGRLGTHPIDAIYILTKFERNRLDNLEQTIMLLNELGFGAPFLVTNSDSKLLYVGDAILVSVPHVEWTEPRSAIWPSYKGWNIGHKRAFVHRHAQFNGFRRITMIDDDIVIGEDLLNDHRELSRNYDIISTKVRNYPDNSIIFHAAREVLGYTVMRPSGSLMSVDVMATRNAFLNVYNEDWFFLL